MYKSVPIPVHVEEKMKRSLRKMDSEPTVGIGLGSEHDKVTRTAILNAGGLEGFIKANDTVVIKPNLVKPSLPNEAVTTDYRVVQEVVNMVKECGAGKIIIAEASPFGDEFEPAKFNKISGAKLFNMDECKEDECYRLKPEGSLTNEDLLIPKIYMDADIVISVAKLKTHTEAGVTLSLKNSIGVPPTGFYGTGTKLNLHLWGLEKAIVDINKIRKPDFAVIDGIIGGEGDGPLWVRPVQSNIVFAGVDPVAVDTAALDFMGFSLEEVPHVKLASKEGLGIADLTKIKINGADLTVKKMKFQRY
ncbi:DUF362 domain-containing protein [Anaerocolumna sedimenticola]|uniref:DUF362 domain-containing protein n=1 Tax=Anaerocolumna sedimenticola TaxID=2696063 RepID=A0A6P1TLH7_9FIRM|nr:DUF362 domain-containing protein [Anaerocolumna sedimenticola]QHQ61894.1 DUF362 domain-containing protein [Anaerocolumna sedimenticola]